MLEANDTNRGGGWIRLLITSRVIIALIGAIATIAAAWINAHPAQPQTTPISARATTSAQSQAHVIACLTDTRYVADPNPAPDHGVLHPVYLQTTFEVRNRGSRFKSNNSWTDGSIPVIEAYRKQGQGS